MSTTLGIDLGTTNSSCAFYDGREVVMVPNERGSRTTPSVVAVSRSGEILVGESARNQSVLHPDRTVRYAKRLMGSSDLIPFGEKKIRAEEAGSYVLARLKADAEAFLGYEVGDAVITVPAYFSEAQRRSTREAGTLAGLNVRRLLNEPTAAAIAWAWSSNRNYGEEGNERRLLVYDLGGGTFDATVLSMRGRNCTVLAASGDNSLGGMDFDGLLMERALEVFESQLGKGSVRSDPVLGQQLSELVERAKMELSVRPAASVTLPFVGSAKGEHPSWLIRREEFEEMISPFIDRTMEIVSRTLAEAGGEGLDHLVLSGGSSRIPLVRRRLAALVGREAEARVNPEEIVSFGAAVFASLAGPAPAADGFSVRDAVSRTFGVEIDGDNFVPLIAKNTPIPVSSVRAFTTVVDGQSTVEIHVLQGESRKASENLSLGRFLLSGIRDGKRGEPRIELEFSIDPDEILHVRAHDVDTGVAHAVTIAAGPDGSKKISAERLLSLAARARDLAGSAVGDRSLELEIRATAEEAELVARETADHSGNSIPEALGKRAETAAWALEVLIAELESRKPVGG